MYKIVMKSSVKKDLKRIKNTHFAPVRHLPLTLPVYFSLWPNKKRVA